MQTAGDLVGILVELTACVKLGHDNFGGGDAFAGVYVGRDAAAIVGNGDRAIGIERDRDDVGMAGQGFIDRIVDDFIDHVMQARTVVSVTDIHAGALADSVQSLQNLDRVRAIFGRTIIFRDRQVGHSAIFPVNSQRPG